MEEKVAAGETRKNTESRRVDVLGGEEEEVDSDAGFDALLGADAVEGVLREEEGLLLVGTVQLGILAVLERAGTDGGERSLEDVELTAEVFLCKRGKGCVSGTARVDIEGRRRTRASNAAFKGPPIAASTIEVSAVKAGRVSRRFSMAALQ